MSRKVNILDDSGEIIGITTKKRIYNEKLNHQIVHVFLVNSSGKIYIPKRPKYKKFLPNYNFTSIGGHVHFNETFEKSAINKIKKDFSINTQIEKIDDFVFESGSHKRFIRLFVAHINNSLKNCTNFYSIEEIYEMMSRGDKIHPQLEACFDKYVEYLKHNFKT